MTSSDRTASFDPADRLAQDRESVRRRFWIKFGAGVRCKTLLALRRLGSLRPRASLGLPGLELPEQGFLVRVRLDVCGGPGLCLRNSSNLARDTASMLWLFSHCSATGRRC